jgi:phosphoribosylformimino-5-aminoimidazole carboxamide ribotide isomerase
MQVIPVIDLLNGTVVHAKKGDRKNYQAIQSSITASSKPVDVVTALLEFYPFQQLYIADLNAIQKIGNNNFAEINSIAQQYPNLKIWVDAGIRHISELAFWNDRNFNVILASENFSDLDNFLNTKAHLTSDYILSLDFMLDGYRGPPELVLDTQYWPENIILMSLAHVGANQGTNLELLNQFKEYATQFNLYAAGGIRNLDDLIMLKQTGIHGALLASALHSRQILPDDINSLAQ